MPLTLAAQDALITSNLKLATWWVNRFRRLNSAGERDELIGAAVEGVVRAARRYEPECCPDPGRPKFSPWAAWYIRAAVNEYERKTPRLAQAHGSTLDAIPDRAGREVDPRADGLMELADRVLPERYRRVVRMRFIDGKTLQQVGDALGGVTRQRVKQMQVLALRRLRRELTEAV